MVMLEIRKTGTRDKKICREIIAFFGIEIRDWSYKIRYTFLLHAGFYFTLVIDKYDKEK